jgi:phenolic acid decarboxylase
MQRTIFITAFTLILISCNPTNENLNLPDQLLGVEMSYQYSGGNEYTLKFEEAGLSYQYRTGSSPDRYWGPFEYNHMMTENDEHFVSWFEPGYGDYVTLLINFDTSVLYGSAIIAGKTIHFQKAKIQNFINPNTENK